jgi:glycogen phosphorylase
LGFPDINKIFDQESEQGLGMSGLGRVSVCIMEALTTHNVPAMGYGLRYDFGSFT